MDSHHPNREFFVKQSQPRYSDELIRDTAAGSHQKLVRQGDRYVLIVRNPDGVYMRHAVTVLENGVLA